MYDTQTRDEWRDRKGMIDVVNATMKFKTFKSVCFAADILTLCMTPFI